MSSEYIKAASSVNYGSSCIGNLLDETIIRFPKVVTFPDLRVVSITHCTLRGRDLIAFHHSYLPIWPLWPQYRKLTSIRELYYLLSFPWRRSHTLSFIESSCCSLASHPSWEKNVFHWFIDILPRLLVAERIVGMRSKLKLLKSAPFLKWQIESLSLLGYDATSLTAIPDKSRISVQVDHFLGLCDIRKPRANCLPPYPIHPFIVKALKQRFDHLRVHTPIEISTRFIVVRAVSLGRCFVNMSQIEAFAMKYSFLIVDLANFALDDQIRMFQSATHIIAPHGAGLTHIIHSSDAAILEVHCTLHGVRTEYFQIAAINRLRYYYHVCKPVNHAADMYLDTCILEKFMQETSD